MSVDASGAKHDVALRLGAALQQEACPQVAARACLAIGASLNLCGACGTHGGEGVQPSPQQLGELAAQLVGALTAHPADPAVAAAGLHLLLRLAGCSACRLPSGRELQDALGAAGAVPAAVAALGALTSSPTSSSSSDGDGAAPPSLQQQHAGALSDGLQALHYMCNRHAGNLAQLGACGGMQVVAGAMAAASSEWPAEEHGLLLLAQLACRQGASTEEQQAAALAIWQAAQAQVERRLVEVGRAAVWGMARVLQCLQDGAAGSPAAAQLIGELQLQGAAVALAMLQSCDKKDDPLMKHCLDLLAVAASGSAPLPAGVAAALLSREAATAVLVVAGQAGELRTQATALRTLYCLCRAGGCGLTWQQLAAAAAAGSGQPAEDAELVMGASSVAAAVFAVVAAASQAAAASGKDAAGSAAADSLAVQLYGLAAVGALLAAAETRSPAAGAAMAAVLHSEQLAAAQDAVAGACAVLGRSPQLLAVLGAQTEQEGSEARFAVELDSSERCCHLASWQEPVAWAPAADAVRGLLRLLRCCSEGANAADREGFTLLHRLALAGQPRCLELLLSAGGEELDLLLRTRSGANALQLAKQLRHEACVQLLEAATQQAAEARQAALLKELEEMEEEESQGAACKKGKKKKAVTRSISFATEQPEEKAQRMGSSGSSRASSEADEDMPEPSETAAAAAAVEAEQQRELEEHLRARQEREEAYERALEQRRQELAALQAAAEAATSGGCGGAVTVAAIAVSLPAGTAGGEEEEQSELQSVGSGTSERQQPGTPDHDDDLGASGTASATPAVTGVAADGATADSSSSGSGSSSSPELEQALAQAAAAPPPPAAAAPSTSLLSSGLSALAAQQAQQQPLQAQAQQGLLSGTFAGLGPLGLLQQQQQQAAAAAAALDISRPPHASGASHGLLGSASGSLFGSPTMAAGLAGLPGTAASLGGSVDGSLSSSLAGSPFPGATLGASSPSAVRQLSSAAGLTSMSPTGSLAPFPSPSSAPSRPPGLPPLPGSRSASFGASHQAAAAAASAAAAAASSAADSDQMLSMRLQDALFVGSPAMSSRGPSAQARRAASPQAISGHRHPLFAALGAANSGHLGAGGEVDDDADSIHLLSSSLSCLDDDASDGRGLLARTISGNGSLHGGSRFRVGSDASQRQQEAAAAAAAESLMAGLHQQGLLGRDLSDPSLLAQLSGASLGSPGGGSEGSAGSAAQRGGKDLSSDESLEPTRHLWIGNLGTRTPRAVLKTIFERFGTVDDVVTFPGRMYAFVNYRATEEAVAAFAALQDTQVPELTGDRRLLIKYRPAKKAAIHLRALGLVDEDGAPTDDRMDLDRDGNCTEPSPRIWLGNIAPTATSKNLHAVLGRFGMLTDAAVFPARIGPLGYAFVKFERLEDAIRAFEALNNTVVPPLSGSKQLKMRYKPANDGPVGRAGEDPSDPGKALMVPSRHLWLGNITQKPTDEQVLEVFATFGKVDSVRVFPAKAYAFVNYADITAAVNAMRAVDGLAIPQLTGVKPLVMRYQQESGSATSTPKPSGSASSTPVSSLVPRVASEAALAAMGLNPLVAGGSSAALASLLAGAGAGAAGAHAATAPPTIAGSMHGEGSGSDDGGAMPVPNLSNKLNPNNIHYDAELAERYKHMNRREKDLMWAADSLLHPADAGKGAMWQGHGTNTAAVAAATAQAHAALAVLLQHQQQSDGTLPNQLAQLQRAVTAATHSTGSGGAAGINSGLLSQRLGMHPLAGQHAQHAQQAHLPSGASASQLTAVLNNLTALRRSGSMPSPAHSVGSSGLTSLPPAHSLPLPAQQGGQLSQAELLQQLLLQQQQMGGGLGLDGYGGAAGAAGAAGVAPTQQIHHLSSMLAHQSLGGAGLGQQPGRSSTPMLTPQASGQLLSPQHSTGSLPALSHQVNGMLSPQHSGQMQLSAHHSAHSTGAQQNLAAAFGQLGGVPQAHAPPHSPAGHHGGLTGGGMGQAGTLPSSLPQHFICPLSHQVMTDPVIAADGVTYERQAISEWLAFKDVSPTTQMPLPHKVLTPNAVLRSSLLELLRSAGVGPLAC
ncbi:Flowering time control FPA isoform A [Chlorella sorokiniana]|uniref:Flowering time control FPA isoform A n=1 Tax=Chlorella sorokiniana TaxID=3076 RepID=A0A2P6U2N1_CHLSO|nr:Flowering time control FPA isoform A [Chlorella sorokiniana]|eukprot:PRW60572.1 Flowering time control FPA isoform A [Chlorella sorokiniana]